MNIIEKEPWDFRLWITLRQLPKHARNGLLMGRTFDEWLNMEGAEFFSLMLEHHPDLKKIEGYTDCREYKTLHFRIGNTQVPIGYRNPIRDEVVGSEYDPWGFGIALPKYSEKITGYGIWIIFDNINFNGVWENLLVTKRERIEKAREEFNR